MKYQLISYGRLLGNFEEQESITRIRQITKLSEEQVQKSLLNGKPRKLLSSNDKEKVKKAAFALRQAGLEVKVNVDQASSEAQVGEPGDIAPYKEREYAGKERIDFLPPSTAPPKKKSGCSRCLIFFLLIILAGGLRLVLAA